MGAGPAGCAAALSLPPGTRGLLVDRSSLGGDCCCGGLLAPDAQEALATLGLTVPADLRVLPEPRAVHAHDLDNHLQQTYRRDYLNVDRGRFDSWLLALAAEHVEVRRQTRFAGLCGEGVVLKSGSRTQNVRAGALIAVDGAGSSMRKTCFPGRPGPPLMLALQAKFARPRAGAARIATLPATAPPSADPPDHVVLFSSALTGFYAWAIPKGDEMLIGCAFHDVTGARERFERVLEWYQRELGLEGPAYARRGRYLSQPRAWGDLCAGDGQVLLAGEAAGLVSPSSGEGISFALLSGAAAGRAVGAAGAAARAGAYRKGFAPLARKVMLKTVKARIIYSPSARRLALRLPWCP